MAVEYNPFNNPEFRKEMGELLDEKLGPISTKVAEHEATIQQGKGALGLLSGIFAVLWGALEFFLHRR